MQIEGYVVPNKNEISSYSPKSNLSTDVINASALSLNPD